MIDFLKVALDRVAIEELLLNPRLDFRSAVSEQTSEIIKYPKIAEYQELTFKIKSKEYCEMTGSLHKFVKVGVNHEDFTYLDVVNAINRLKDELGIDVERARIQNVEVGVNLFEIGRAHV